MKIKKILRQVFEYEIVNSQSAVTSNAKPTTVKTLFLFLVIALLTFKDGHTQTNVSGGIYTNTSWTLDGSPYIVVDTVTVFANVTLSIEPGVIVKVNDDKFIEIRGSLLANGTANDTIMFTSNSLVPSMSIWKGIYLNSNAFLNLNYSQIKYAQSAILYLFSSVDVTIEVDNINFKKYEYEF